MKQKKFVKTGKYIAIGLLMVLLAMLTVGCANQSYTGTVDPDMVEHNPNQPVNPLPEDKAENSMPDAEDGTLPGQQPGNADGTGFAGGEPDGTGDSTPGPEENGEQPDVEDNSEQEQNAEPVTPEYVVVLDPGHGGAFTGAVYGLVEKEVVLKIANYAREYLQTNYPKLEVKMTRETDKDFDTQLAKDLENRVQLGKEMGADVFVSFHLNASAAHNIQGAEVICPHRENVKEDSFLLANHILDELTVLGIKRRGIVTKNSNDTVDANGNPVEYYAINRHAANRDMVGIIIEHCFMDNETDKTFLADDEALQRLGEADARGIAAYFGY